MEANEKWRGLIEEHPVRCGAVGAVRLVGAYASAFLLYAMLRSSVELVIAADADLLLLLVSNAVSILLSGVAIAAVMLVIAVPLGIVTMALIARLLPYLHPAHARWQAGVLGVAVAFAVQLVVQGTLYLATGFSFVSVPPETWLFWVGLPAALHIGAAGVVAGYSDRFSAAEEGPNRTQTRTIRTAILR